MIEVARIEAAATLSVRGQTLLLHPERAVQWCEQRAVIVADTHFGKSGIFRRHGVPVPDGSDEHDRQRLGSLLRRVGALRLIVLGDFLHGSMADDSAETAALEAWCAALQPIEIHIVAGNHDRRAAPRWKTLVHWREGAWQQGPFTFIHSVAGATHDAQWFMSGHIHPVVRLGGLRKRAARVPVFWQRASGLVLPAFGIFTGGFAIAPGPGERVFAVGPDRVVPFQACRG